MLRWLVLTYADLLGISGTIPVQSAKSEPSRRSGAKTIPECAEVYRIVPAIVEQSVWVGREKQPTSECGAESTT